MTMMTTTIVVDLMTGDVAVEVHYWCPWAVGDDVSYSNDHSSCSVSQHYLVARPKMTTKRTKTRSMRTRTMTKR